MLLAFDLLASAATLRPVVRLSLFLPVTSYLFSDAPHPRVDAAARRAAPPKAEATVTGTKGAGGGPARRAGRVTFLGYHVFFNVHASARSFAFGKNPQLLAGYMVQTLERRLRQDE
ncbi:hypothetical protein E2562_016262 [Oryza meyeriana var. granulata]|uniref:Uncharacterized protein n=1 Tax=Oryza meyeriana var. granulata TaxID=110450 RepID=A0A6G1CQR1_9ORYZ|nr:hypothetical protein E2562_016262 [Oryza meyeriana var. granulata]